MTQMIPGQDVLDSLTDYEAVKEKISCRLVNAEQNAEVLTDRPHTMVDDLAVTYHIQLGKSEGGTMSTPVTNSLVEKYGISTEQLHEAAIRNMVTMSPSSFKGMSETMAELLLHDMQAQGMSEEEARQAAISFLPSNQEEAMYVLSNTEKLHGAAALLDTRIMDDITKRVGTEYFILPSSIHEVLIVPKTDEMDLKTLEDMVRDVNATQVSPEERLSDHVYAYDANAHELFRADRAVEKEKKPSITGALKSPLPETGRHAIKPPVAGDDAR